MYIENHLQIEELTEEYKREHNLYIVVTWSGGKDSTVVVLEALKQNIPIDEIIFFDTFYEFKDMYGYMGEIKSYINQHYPNRNIKFTTIGNPDIFTKWSQGKFVRGKFKGKMRGFPLTVGMSYCTRELKTRPYTHYFKEINKTKKVVSLIGIALNELNRVRTDDTILYPLINWDMTEDDCITYLKNIGLHNPLYDKFSRLGCWMCPKQNFTSLKILITEYPEYWKQIKEWEAFFIQEDSPFALFKIYGTEYWEERLLHHGVNSKEILTKHYNNGLLLATTYNKAIKTLCRNTTQFKTKL